MKKMQKWKIKLQSYRRKHRQSNQEEITWEEAYEKREKENGILLDVRSIQEYNEGHKDGAICIPHYELENNAQAKLTKKDQTIILYCQTGARSKKAYQTLKKLGYQNVYEVKGGINN